MSVTIYSTPSCPYCVMVKNYLTEKGVPYVDHNVGDDRAKAEEMVLKSGQMGVPVVDVNGTIIIGFDQARIDRALAVT